MYWPHLQFIGLFSFTLANTNGSLFCALGSKLKYSRTWRLSTLSKNCSLSSYFMVFTFGKPLIDIDSSLHSDSSVITVRWGSPASFSVLMLLGIDISLKSNQIKSDASHLTLFKCDIKTDIQRKKIGPWVQISLAEHDIVIKSGDWWYGWVDFGLVAVGSRRW